ncbi:flavodoxin family protein [Nocardia tengchongensis]|uniref:flavodoxin family protein n=1 Tax=Nocardia tengchongensis TaxID=2055889 RepID=UPI00368B5FF7
MTESTQPQDLPIESVRIAVAFHSGYGHTARQAEAVADGAGSVQGTVVDLVNVDDPEDQALWLTLEAADAIIFGAPTYMGSPSAVFKAFTERTSKVLADNLRWRDKIAAGFTTSGGKSGDKFNTLVDLTVFAAQHGMIWVGLDLPAGWSTSNGTEDDLNRIGSWLGAMAQANADQGPELAPPGSDLRTAFRLGERVAEITWIHRSGTAIQQSAKLQPVQ